MRRRADRGARHAHLERGRVSLEGVARDDDRRPLRLTHGTRRSQVPVHDVQADPAVRRRVEGLRHGAHHLETEVRHSRTAAVLVSTTALNCIARQPCSRAQARTHSPSARPTPRPRARSATMKDAVADVAAARGPVGAGFAEPRTVPSSPTATTVIPGGDSTHRSCAAADVRPSGTRRSRRRRPSRGRLGRTLPSRVRDGADRTPRSVVLVRAHVRRGRAARSAGR